MDICLTGYSQGYVYTLLQVSPCVCSIIMVGSHCRTDQLDRPNSPTKLDQLLYTTFSRLLLDHTRPPHDHLRNLHDFNPTTTPISTRSSRPLHDLCSTNSTSTQPIPDHFPMARPLLNQYPINQYRVDREAIGY